MFQMYKKRTASFTNCRPNDAIGEDITSAGFEVSRVRGGGSSYLLRHSLH